MTSLPKYNPWAPPIFPTQQAQSSGGGLLAPPGRFDNVHTIAPGPEYDKWDETLMAHGRIRIPKELDDPQVWLNAPHFQGLLQNIDRQDLPDGSVILSRIMPMS